MIKKKKVRTVEMPQYPATKDMQQLNIRVPAELLREFTIYCLRCGRRPREVIVQWMRDALAAREIV